MSELRSILTIESTRPLELACGVGAILRGATAFLARDEAVFGAPVAHFTASLFPVEVWGAIGLLTGGAQIAGLLVDSRPLRLTAALISQGVVACLAFAFIRHDPGKIAAPMYVSVFLSQFFISLRLCVDRKRVRRHRALS